MTAREMFERVGFFQVENDATHIKYANDLDDAITFYFNLKGYETSVIDFYVGLHKAIHKQLEELGWLEVTAGSLFRELGYKLVEYEFECIRYVNEEHKEIYFNKTQAYYLTNVERVDKDLNNAIQKQIEELEWI